ncbi:SRPBCC domain-containing protein [Actinomadura viridis]|uniref:SRPBCC family protein n=1 Tax=Actinomadura viridis TaxID=58110 RepID=UPI0036740E2B
MTREHRHEIEIDASSDDVWRAVTDGDELTRWYAGRATSVPGEGGAVTVGWENADGGLDEGTSRIEVWEPGRRLRLVDEPAEGFPAADGPTVQEWTIEVRGGRTVLRLVHSGFPESDDWDGIYDSTDHGWDAFLHYLRFYLERHLGEPRLAVVATRPSPAGWGTLTAALGLAGDRFATTTASGERLSGRVLLERDRKVLLASVDQLDDGVLFMTLEAGGVWSSLAAYGRARGRLAGGLGAAWRTWMLEICE